MAYTIAQRSHLPVRRGRLAPPAALTRGRARLRRAPRRLSPAAARRREVVRAIARVVLTALQLGGGVALALSGLAITGGSFGLFAFIGIPLMAVGLGMITSIPRLR